MGCAFFVETGTFLGDMVAGVRGSFDQVISIELDDDLYEQARVRFQKDSAIRIIRGDSAEVLPEILSTLNASTLFWLDGHYSGPGTAMGRSVSPVMDELAALLHHPVGNHVIMIDDARLFTASDGYPELAEVMSLVAKLRPDMTTVVRDDIISICPEMPPGA
ncbi:MAG: hypothetical protein HC802_10340 [Caldilineaceae bacterium]|nr:hypothetical protein [Caldilineaceae bacterium]